MVGEVTDSSGAIVPGATVTLTDATAGVKLTDTTNADGKYVFPSVPPGTYSVSASKSGFSITKTEGQEVNIGTQLTLNLKLKVGGAVTVTASVVVPL